MNYNVGDINISTMLLSSSRGSIDFSQSFIDVSIYESIFTPGMVCDITILDTQDLLGYYKLSGDETLTLTTSIPGSLTTNWVFALYDISDVKSVGAQKSKMYVLHCVSEEAMYAKINYVEKAYTKLCNEMIQDIHTNSLMSKKTLNTEATMSPQTIIAPHVNPYDAINMIRKRSVSLNNKSSSYVYFENHNTSQQFNFVTVEGLFSNSSVKSFVQSDAINTDMTVRNDNNILSYTVPKQLSSIDKIELGGNRNISSLNFATQEWKDNIVSTTDTQFKTGGVSGSGSVSTEFNNKYLQNSKPMQSLIPVDISQRPSTNIPESSANYQAYLALLMQNAMKVRVPGDLILTAGAKINLSIPTKQGFTVAPQNDPLLSGDFIISRIHHRIGKTVEKPRYTCIIECIKGGYNAAL